MVLYRRLIPGEGPHRGIIGQHLHFTKHKFNNFERDYLINTKLKIKQSLRVIFY
jgi:hypothetical protein